MVLLYWRESHSSWCTSGGGVTIAVVYEPINSSLYLLDFSGECGLVGSNTDEAYSIAALINVQYAVAFADGTLAQVKNIPKTCKHNSLLIGKKILF